MKTFSVIAKLKRAELEEDYPDEELECWLEDRLQHLTYLFAGHGQVSVSRVDPLRVDVELSYAVEGGSLAAVMVTFANDFEQLSALNREIRIVESRRFKLCFPKIAGEELGALFIRVNPETHGPMYTED